MTGALFEAWRGRYADSPRALSQELARRFPSLRQRWVHDGVSDPPPAPLVRRHSPAYFARLLASDLVVSNDIISKHLVKGRGVTYVQTWHGTPLKVIGLDERDSAYAGARAHRERMLRDVAKWDILLSPSPTCTRIFRGAFGFDGEVLETGYPRNDMLVADDGTTRARVRAGLGIPDDATAVLYAPTWRDDAKNADGQFVHPVDFPYARALEVLPPGSVVLNRLHKNVHAPAGSTDPRVVEVSAYPEIAELFLAADVLVSDYSSAIFDFAVTGKPIVLFSPDLDHYRGSLRPFYFDYETWAPGPVARTADELVAFLEEPTEVARTSRERYATFVETFCPHEDGRASERVIDALVARGVLSAPRDLRDRAS